MEAHSLLARARREAGLSQATLAEASGTSRTALSAYENGHKSPTLETASRIVGAAGYALAIEPAIAFRQVGLYRGRPIVVPTSLPRLPLHQAFAVVELPIHVNWSEVGRRFDLRDRQQRARVYERVLRDGAPDDVVTYVDGALLVDVWEDVVLPQPIYHAWMPVVRDFIVRAGVVV